MRKKVEENQIEFDMFFSDVFDAFWKFESRNNDQELHQLALDGLVATSAKILAQRCSIEDALESLLKAKEQFVE